MNALQCLSRNKRAESSSRWESWENHLSGRDIIKLGLSPDLLVAKHSFPGTGIHLMCWSLPLASLEMSLAKLEEASGWPSCEGTWWDLSTTHLPQNHPHPSKTSARASPWEGHAGVSDLLLPCIFFHFQRSSWSLSAMLRPGHLALPKYWWHLPNAASSPGFVAFTPRLK